MIPSSSRSSAGLGDSRSRSTSSSNEEAKDISALLSSVEEHLADFVTDLTQPSSVVTLERRKSYWRILRASRHLSHLKSSLFAIDLNSRGVPPLIVDNQSLTTELLSTGPLTVSENSTTSTELSESENATTGSLSTGMPLPTTVSGNTVIDSIPIESRLPPVTDPEITTEFHSTAPNASTATDSTPSALDIHLPFSESIKSEANFKVADAVTIHSDANISEPPQPVIATTDAEVPANVLSRTDGLIANSSEDLSAHAAPEAVKASGVIIAARMEDEKEVNQRKIASEILEEFSKRMGSVSMETNMQQWLEISRSYWTALRDSKREPVDPLSVPVVEAPMTYFSSNQSQENSSNLRGSATQTSSSSMSAVEEVDLTSDRMHMSGFAGIAKKLPSMHPADVTLTLWGLDKFELWPTQIVATNPSYTYEDNPLPGWSKNICVRMGGKLQGSLEITYCPPERTRRLRNKIELVAYLNRYNLSTYLANRFDFKSVFCVCHTPEDSGSYLECSFGRAGCNGWLHSHCVGLGKRKEGELRDMATVICPLCTQYLESIGATDYMKNKTCLRKITTIVPPTSVVVNGFEVFESSKPHTVWGLALPPSLPQHDRDKERNGTTSYPRSHRPPSPQPSSSSSSSSSSSNSQRGIGTDAVTNAKLQPGEQPSHNLFKTGGALKPTLSGPPVNVTTSSDNSTAGIVPHTAVEIEAVTSTDASAPMNTTINELPAVLKGPVPQVQSLPSLGIVPNPPLERSPPGAKAKTTTSKPLSEDPYLSQLFMHRLFQGASTAEPETEASPEEGNNSVVEVGHDPGSGSGLMQLDDHYLDLKYPVIEYSDSVEPRDRVRWAKVPWIAGDSLSTSSLPSAPSSSSARSFVRVRVTGGWMKARDQSSIAPNTHNGYGSSAVSTALTDNLIEQRVRGRAALDSTLQPSERGLGSRYRRKLLDAVTSSAFSTAHKKKTPGSEGRQSAGYHNQSMDAPLLFYLPCDGGLLATCVTCAPKPLSLSSLCADNELCAFCLNTFDPSMKLLSPAYIAGMQRRRDKDRKSREAKRRKLLGDSYTAESDLESDRFKSPKYLVSKTIGIVSYVLHQQCAFAVDNGGLAGIAALTLKAKLNAEHSLNDRPSDSPTPSPNHTHNHTHNHNHNHSHSHSDLSPDKPFKGIDIGDFYEGDETDDAECDLCGRAGGIMQFFDLDTNFSSMPPPNEEGWLGHVPCISWLMSSRLLELPPSFLCKRGFLMGESPAANFNEESYSPLRHSDSKDYVKDSPSSKSFLELHGSNGSAVDMRAEEVEGRKESEIDVEVNGVEATAMSPHRSTFNDDQRGETGENAIVSNCDEISSDTVEISTPLICPTQTAIDGVSVSTALNDTSLPHEPAITMDDDSTEGGNSSCAQVHDTSPDAAASTADISLKRGLPDGCDGPVDKVSHTVDTSEASPSPKRPKTSSDTENQVDSSEKSVNESFKYWSAENSFEKRYEEGTVPFALIQDQQECLSQEGVLQSEMSIVPDCNVGVLPLQSGVVSAAPPDTNPAAATTQPFHGSNPSLSIETSFSLHDRQGVDTHDSTAPSSPAGQTRDTPRKQSNLSESERIGYSGRKDLSKVRPLSLFDSLVGQWRCSCCGTYAGVVLKCSAVACTVRAHPLCVSIAGPKWTAFEVTPSSSGLNQPGHASQTALAFLCSLHSPKGTE